MITPLKILKNVSEYPRFKVSVIKLCKKFPEYFDKRPKPGVGQCKINMMMDASLLNAGETKLHSDPSYGWTLQVVLDCSEGTQLSCVDGDDVIEENLFPGDVFVLDTRHFHALHFNTKSKHYTAVVWDFYTKQPSEKQVEKRLELLK